MSLLKNLLSPDIFGRANNPRLERVLAKHQEAIESDLREVEKDVEVQNQYRRLTQLAAEADERLAIALQKLAAIKDLDPAGAIFQHALANGSVISMERTAAELAGYKTLRELAPELRKCFETDARDKRAALVAFEKEHKGRLVRLAREEAEAQAAWQVATAADQAEARALHAAQHPDESTTEEGQP